MLETLKLTIRRGASEDIPIRVESDVLVYKPITGIAASAPISITAVAHDAEKGRGCLEFWLGIASARGIKLSVPKTSTLLDGIYTQQEHFYGYDTLAVTLRPRESGGVTVGLDPIAHLPSAEEIEDRYDHSQHPNRLVSG